MEAINGWVKAELFMDFHVTGIESIEHEIANYITFFNEQRPAYSMSDNDESSEQKIKSCVHFLLTTAIYQYCLC